MLSSWTTTLATARPRWCRGEFSEVTLVTAPTNIGFARATNIAIRQGSAEYVLALNPDAEMRSGTLDALLRLMDEHPEIGICGCRLERPDGSFDHASRRSFPTILGALGHLLGPGRHRSGGRLAQYRAVEVERGPVDAVNGAFMLMRRSMLDEIGLFDEAYWMYMEDLDLCYRRANRRLDHVVRAGRERDACEGRDGSPENVAALDRSVLPEHAPLRPDSSRRSATPGSQSRGRGRPVSVRGSRGQDERESGRCSDCPNGVRRDEALDFEKERITGLLDMSSAYHVVGET